LVINDFADLKTLLFSNYMGLSLVSVLFFVIGNNIKYFFTINNLLYYYLLFSSIFTVFYLKYFELQLFILLPVFYVILTIPLQKPGRKFLIVLISILIVLVSLTNRAGILRILISYCLVVYYYLMLNVRISKKLVNLLVFIVLMIPIIAIYLGINGFSVFQLLAGDDIGGYSQMNPYADTRTFLFYEVFQDLKINNAFLFGKGLNAGYISEVFATYSRPIVEVGFLQLVLKTGLFGFLLYSAVIFSAIYKALSLSRNHFMKSLGLLLVSYYILFFIENIIAYNLLNVVIWMVVGMCHSKALLSLNNFEIKKLINNGLIGVNNPLLSSKQMFKM
jgi:hypothetical protein